MVACLVIISLTLASMLTSSLHTVPVFAFAVSTNQHPSMVPSLILQLYYNFRSNTADVENTAPVPVVFVCEVTEKDKVRNWCEYKTIDNV